MAMFFAVSLFVLLSRLLLTFLERCCVHYQNTPTCAYTHKHADTLVTFSLFHRVQSNASEAYTILVIRPSPRLLP